MGGVFEELFSYRPRDNMSPRENFLTAALAYVLNAEPPAMEAFVRLSLSEKGAIIDGKAFATRHSVVPGKRDAGYPDLQVTATLKDGRALALVYEHKWDMEVDPGQLKRYLKALPRNRGVSRLLLISRERSLPKGCPDRGSDFLPLTWSDVHAALSLVPLAPGSLLPDFLEFLVSNDLGTEPALSRARLAAYAYSWTVPETCGALIQRMAGMDWSSLPAPFQRPKPVKVRWGRYGLETDPSWDKHWRAPSLFLGFLLDPGDHDVQFTNPARGIDLMVTIDLKPERRPDPHLVDRALAGLDRGLEGVTVRWVGDLRNRYRLVMLRAPVADLLPEGGDLEVQAKALHKVLVRWCRVLFKDGEVVKMLEKAHPRWTARST